MIILPLYKNLSVSKLDVISLQLIFVGVIAVTAVRDGERSVLREQIVQ